MPSTSLSLFALQASRPSSSLSLSALQASRPSSSLSLSNSVESISPISSRSRSLERGRSRSPASRRSRLPGRRREPRILPDLEMDNTRGSHMMQSAEFITETEEQEINLPGKLPA
ncbi:Hypothetical predicted protein [Mytilus galloprovincialis]|uniref:Uncharacterized protein n=1 Tax=Mytilus galloprovincialis TaxID=29158 RepID=A0A8B6BKB9_MYTGA|nr:Hypothetical predicted protein [Mytilus galloprovincialis]